MKKILVLCAALAMLASSAYAAGVDLSVVACPGGVGASSDAGTIDCAGGAMTTILITFLPPNPLPDLTGIDGVMDAQIGGDLSTTATFWEFSVTNAAALGFSHIRPSTGCTTYTATWQPAGSGEGGGGSIKSPTVQHISYLAYRPSGLAVIANQKLWGVSVSIDASTSAEFNAGVGPTGCTLPVCLVINSLNGRGVSGVDEPEISAPALLGNQITFNGAAPVSCAGVPAKKHTWGQLKSPGGRVWLTNWGMGRGQKDFMG